VATLSSQSDSVLSLYRTLISLRNSNAALNTGQIEEVASKSNILRYQRSDGEQRFAILLNLSESHGEAPIAVGHVLASTHMDRSGEAVESSLSLRPYEGLVVKLAASAKQ
jgi:alpha-glucosidase